MVGREGFEPPKAEPADLQSAPFGHSGTCPKRPADYSETVPEGNFYLTFRVYPGVPWHLPGSENAHP